MANKAVKKEAEKKEATGFEGKDKTNMRDIDKYRNSLMIIIEW